MSVVSEAWGILLSHTRHRTVLLGIAASAVPLGLLARRFGEPDWLRNGAGAVLYEVFWIAAAQALFLRSRPGIVAGGVFATTCLFELLQLSRHPWLVALRSTLAGRLVLGSNGGFDLLDLAWYAAGSTLGWAALHLVRRQVRQRTGGD